MSQRTKPILTGIRAAAGCLGDLLLWWVVVPCAAAFVFLVFFVPDPFVVSSRFQVFVVVVIVIAARVVLLTATAGHLRAKEAAIERQMRDEEDPWAENP